MRVIVRRERPHPGAQLTPSTDRRRLPLPGLRHRHPASGSSPHLEARHRAHARVEDRIRCGKDTGLGRFPSRHVRDQRRLARTRPDRRRPARLDPDHPARRRARHAPNRRRCATGCCTSPPASPAASAAPGPHRRDLALAPPAWPPRSHGLAHLPRPSPDQQPSAHEPNTGDTGHRAGASATPPTQNTTPTAPTQWHQRLTERPGLAFRDNVLCVVSDGITARYGTAFTPFEHYAPWNVDHDGQARPHHRRRCGPGAQPGPTRAVQAASGSSTSCAATSPSPSRARHRPEAHRQGAPVLRGEQGGRRRRRGASKRRQGRRRLAHPGLGQVDGDGAVHAAQVMRHPALRNPTIVVLTDRNDLDDQLYDDLRRQRAAAARRPMQVDTREQLRTELATGATGGIIFTTLQKFGLYQGGEGRRQRPPAAVRPPQHPGHRRRGAPQPLRHPRRLRPAPPRRPAERHAHRLHRHADLDRRGNTRDVFGDYIDVYDLTRAVDDGATVGSSTSRGSSRSHLPEGRRPGLASTRGRRR